MSRVAEKSADFGLFCQNIAIGPLLILNLPFRVEDDLATVLKTAYTQY
jgi:hypothetical protein